jgi:dihydrofolate synthase/folylpolyglutamate synthase
LEVASRHPLVLLDGAHNPDGAEALAGAIGEVFLWKRLLLVIGVLEGKDLEGIVAPLASRTHSAFACASSHPKAVSAERMAQVCDAAGIPAIAYPTVAAALDAAERAAAADDLILVTGSLYTVADARPRYLRGT